MSYDFGLTRFEVTGAFPFLDDFADGLRDDPPTSSLADALGVTTEQVGSLRLSDTDGADPFTQPLSPSVAGLQDWIILGAPPGGGFAGFRDGFGNGTFITRWSEPLPKISGSEYSRGYSQRVTFASGSENTEFGVAATKFFQDLLPASACAHAGPQVYMLHSIDPFTFLLACDPIDPQDDTGAIVLELEFDDAANTFAFAYSLDGGNSFAPSSAWAAPIAFVPVPNMLDNLGLVGAAAGAAEAPSVPGPGAAVAIPLLLAGLSRRVRSMARSPAAPTPA